MQPTIPSWLWIAHACPGSLDVHVANLQKQISFKNGNSYHRIDQVELRQQKRDHHSPGATSISVNTRASWATSSSVTMEYCKPQSSCELCKLRVGWVFSCKRNKYLILPSSLLDKALNERNSIAPSTFNRHRRHFTPLTHTLKHCHHQTCLGSRAEVCYFPHEALAMLPCSTTFS